MRHSRVDPIHERLDRRPDSDLVARAASGDASSFEELYRRYSSNAWRVAYAVAGNRDDAADAVSEAFTRVFEVLPGGRLAEGEFGPYLLAVTRNAAIDTLRRSGRLEPTDQMESLDRPAGAPSPFDRVVQGEDSSIVARAFRSLPERWRSVLWMTEVEGIPPREVGVRMGLTANTAAQLATRARAGLRERYLQAHLNERVDQDCRFAVERLGAYVAGRLAPRELAKVDQHLAGCGACRARLDELNDVGATLRRLAIPLPALLGQQAFTRWRTATNAASSAKASTFGVTVIPETLLRFQKPLLAVSSGLFALGVISASVVGNPGAPFGEARRVIERVPRDPGPLVVDDAVSGPELAAPTEPLALDLDLGFDAVDPVDPTPAPAPTGRREQPRGSRPAPPPRRGVLTGVPETGVAEPATATGLSVALGPVDLGVSIAASALSEEEPCVGAEVTPGTTVGCPPPAPPEGAGVIIVTIGGSGVGVVDHPSLTIVTPV